MRIRAPIGHTKGLAVNEFWVAVDFTCIVDPSRDIQPYFNVACTAMMMVNDDTYV